MNTVKTVLTALFFVAAGSAVAAPGTNTDLPTVTVNAGTVGANSGEAYQGFNTAFVSTKTRAQVRQELLAARANGSIFDGEAYPGPLVSTSNKSRTDVVAELSAYRASHVAIGEDGALAQLR